MLKKKKQKQKCWRKTLLAKKRVLNKIFDFHSRLLLFVRRKFLIRRDVIFYYLWSMLIDFSTCFFSLASTSQLGIWTVYKVDQRFSTFFFGTLTILSRYLQIPWMMVKLIWISRIYFNWLRFEDHQTTELNNINADFI